MTSITKTGRIFSKFIVIGALSTVFNYSVFIILYSILSINYLYASAIGFICGLILGMYFNKSWTFEFKQQFSRLLVIQYLSVYTISLSVSLLFLEYSVRVLFIDPIYSNFLAIVITTIMNFVD